VLCGVVNTNISLALRALLFRWTEWLEHQKMGPMQPVPTLEGSLGHCAHSWPASVAQRTYQHDGILVQSP
jgi:hypothetical protein